MESYPESGTSVALLDCPHCIDEFRFDYQKIARLAYGWRVRVRCPGCGNIIEVVMLAYTLINNCDPDKYEAGEIVEILPPDPNPSPEWRMAVNKLRMEILQKKTGWRPDGTSSGRGMTTNGSMCGQNKSTRLLTSQRSASHTPEDIHGLDPQRPRNFADVHEA